MLGILHFSLLHLVNRHRLLENRRRLPDRWHQRGVVDPDTAAETKAASLVRDDRSIAVIEVMARGLLETGVSAGENYSRPRALPRTSTRRVKSFSRAFIQPTCNNNRPSPWTPTDSGSFSTVPPSRAK